MEKVGERIKRIRHEKGWSQTDVAELIGISVPAFSKIETGVTDVNLSRLEQIAAIFGISLVRLMDLNDDKRWSVRTEEQDALYKRLQTRDLEVMDLQKKVIDLYEELRHSNLSKSK